MAGKRIVLLGATGSIGEGTLRVLRGNPDDLELVGIAGHSRVEELAKISREFGVRHVAIFDQKASDRARKNGLFGGNVELLHGVEGLNALASLPEADLVVIAIVGTTGLHPSLAAIESGKDIALASKEILVLAGQFITDRAKENQVSILPMDSEHNAIFQCLQGGSRQEVRRLIVTASGGPFRDATREEMKSVGPDEAMKHPTWSMGPKITIDSSTMANKGLEIIEARWLFGMQPDQIQVVIHPQSIVHSMVEYIDGSIIAQLSPPSMTFAIQHVLLYPNRAAGVDNTLDFAEAIQLDFHPPDTERFPCLRLARSALESGGIAPGVFNAANEVAVAAFIDRRIPYLAISDVIEETLDQTDYFLPDDLDEMLEADRAARAQATGIVDHHES